MAVMTTRTMLFLTTFFAMAVLVNLQGCLWWFLAITQGIDNSWASPDCEQRARPQLPRLHGRPASPACAWHPIQLPHALTPSPSPAGLACCTRLLTAICGCLHPARPP